MKLLKTANKFYRPWFSQEKHLNSDEWALLDQRGLIISTKQGKWPGWPLSSDEDADNWKGYCRKLEDSGCNFITYSTSEDKKTKVYRSQNVICVYFDSGKLQIVCETIVRKGSVTKSISCTSLENNKSAHKEYVQEFDNAVDVHTSSIFTEIKLLKQILDKPKYEKHTFHHIIGNSWEFKELEPLV